MCPLPLTSVEKSDLGQSDPTSNLQSSLSPQAAPEPPPVTPKPDWKAPPPIRMRDPFKFDAAFTRRLVRYLDPLMRTYFRAELRGSENFLREQAKEGAAFTVANLRKWMDQPLAMGLPTEAQNLIILTFAGQTNRSFVRGNVPSTPSIDQMPEDLELREQTLPEPGDWEAACKRAAALFGLTIPM